ncbi:lactate racemase domain-containing protein, partial [Tepidanaerobacter syntrophicus]
MKVRLPYHKTFLDVNIPDENFLGILTSKSDEYKQSLPQDEIVRNALSNPIGSPTLEELVKGKKEVLIITSDHTRP